MKATKEEERFINDLTALMIRHNVVFVADENGNYTIIDAKQRIHIEVSVLYNERIGAERYE